METKVTTFGKRLFTEYLPNGNAATFLCFDNHSMTGLFRFHSDNSTIGYFNGNKTAKVANKGNLFFFYWDGLPFKGLKKVYSIQGKNYFFVEAIRQKGIPKSIKKQLIN